VFAEALYLESLAGMNDELITFNSLTTFFGSNGTGKTSVLKKIHEILAQDSSRSVELTAQHGSNEAILFFRTSAKSDLALGQLLNLADGEETRQLRVRLLEHLNDGESPNGARWQEHLDLGSRLWKLMTPEGIWGKMDTTGIDLYIGDVLKHSEVPIEFGQEVVSKLSNILSLAVASVSESPRWCAYGVLDLSEFENSRIRDIFNACVADLSGHLAAAAMDKVYSRRLPRTSSQNDPSNGVLTFPNSPDYFILGGKILVPMFGMGFQSLRQRNHGPKGRASIILRSFTPSVTDTRNATDDFARRLDNAIGHIADFLVYGSKNPGERSTQRWGDKPSDFSWLGSDFSAANQQQSSPFISSNDAASLFLSDEVFRAIELLSKEVNSIAPAFITKEFDITIHAIHPLHWDREGRRVVVTLRRRGESQVVPAELSGSGIYLWVATSVKIAAEMLLNGIVSDIGGPDGSDYVIGNLVEESLVLIDEPEAYLHPTALYSIRKWIQDMTAKSGQVIMATHSVQMFDIPTFNSSRKLLLRGNSESPQVAVLDFSKDASALSAEASEIGVTAGELFLLTKQFLFVEGEVDKRVLNQWFKEEFAWAGVKVIALHSDRNAKKVFESQLVKGIGADIRYLFDKRIPELPDRDPENDLRMRAEKGFLQKDFEEQDMIAGVRLRVPDFRFKYHQKYDMWWYLNEDLIRQVLKLRRNQGVDWDFTTWDDAWMHFRADIEEQQTRANSQRPPVGGTKSIVPSNTRFKDFLIRTQNFHLERFDDAERIAKAQFKAGLVPEELKRIVDDLIFRI
jgi:AAA domain, putative AbiEii toxin, Type IV TA system